MGADNTFSETNFNPEMQGPQNTCQGEWINDCMYVDCKCAKKALDDMHEMEEDYGKQSLNTGKSVMFWIGVAVVFVLILLAIYLDSFYG